jgi:hypothetical protein
MTKDKNIEKEYKKLLELFSGIAENKRQLVTSLIQNCAFMKVMLDKLQAEILEQGATDTYQNGANQGGTKASASLQAYNSLLKNYVTCINRLNGMLPEGGKLSQDEMEDLLS